MTRLVVKTHRPIQFAVGVILLSMLMAFVTWSILDNVHWSFILDRLQASRERKQLAESNRALEKENAALHERIAALKQNTNLDDQTSALLQQNIRGLQEEIYRLKGELQFYQRVMEASGEGKGLDVHGIYVRPLSQRNGYRLKLILTHVSNKDPEVQGTMNISFEGIRNGITQVLALPDVTLDASTDLNFKFRNFKRFESNIAFPAGFSPQRVFVELEPSDKKQSKIRKVFEWPGPAA